MGADPKTKCRRCSGRLGIVRDAANGRLFSRCPDFGCEQARRRRRAQQAGSYRESVMGDREDRRPTVEERQAYYLSPDGQGYQQALREARTTLEAFDYDQDGYEIAADEVGFSIRDLRAALPPPSKTSIVTAEAPKVTKRTVEIAPEKVEVSVQMVETVPVQSHVEPVVIGRDTGAHENNHSGSEAA